METNNTLIKQHGQIADLTCRERPGQVAFLRRLLRYRTRGRQCGGHRDVAAWCGRKGGECASPECRDCANKVKVAPPVHCHPTVRSYRSPIWHPGSAGLNRETLAWLPTPSCGMAPQNPMDVRGMPPISRSALCHLSF